MKVRNLRIIVTTLEGRWMNSMWVADFRRVTCCLAIFLGFLPVYLLNVTQQQACAARIFVAHSAQVTALLLMLAYRH
jgi:hypothetical protein